jgi:hypothetical protein
LVASNWVYPVFAEHDEKAVVAKKVKQACKALKTLRRGNSEKEKCRGENINAEFAEAERRVCGAKMARVLVTRKDSVSYSV